MIDPKFSSKFLSSEVISKGPLLKHTVYNIKIENKSDQESWEIKKRYKDFRKLYKFLKKNKIQTLNKLPSKRILPNRDKVVEERFNKLEIYLNEILAMIDLSYKYDFILNFVDISTQYRKKMEMYLENNRAIIQSWKKSRIEPLTDFEIKFLIPNFLESLSDDNDQRIHHCKEFFESISRNWTRIRDKDIQFLFFGNQIHRGLIYYCGKINTNFLGSVSCLELLNKILGMEFNPDNERYREIFKKCEFSMIKKLNIHHFINFNKFEHAIECFKLIKIWLSNKSFETDPFELNKSANWNLFSLKLENLRSSML